MCIRDSRVTGRTRRVERRVVVRVGGRIVRSGEASAAAVVPVSYTHLRAHETVLDLVCRLLLEKQTSKNQE